MWPVMHVTQAPPALPDLHCPRTVHVQGVGTLATLAHNVYVHWDTQGTPVHRVLKTPTKT